MKGKREPLPSINHRIRHPKMQLITHTGENLGTVSRDDALSMAEKASLDLVLLTDSGKDGLPVAKIMDYGKLLYERKKKQSESKKHQKVIKVKEIKMRPKIGEHDFQTKIKQSVGFLQSGNRLKITLVFRGRENIGKYERGLAVFARVNKAFDGAGLANDIVQEKESKMGQMWSRIYYLKSAK